jgi:hypothetical protein
MKKSILLSLLPAFFFSSATSFASQELDNNNELTPGNDYINGTQLLDEVKDIKKDDFRVLSSINGKRATSLMEPKEVQDRKESLFIEYNFEEKREAFCELEKELECPEKVLECPEKEHIPSPLVKEEDSLTLSPEKTQNNENLIDEESLKDKEIQEEDSLTLSLEKTQNNENLIQEKLENFFKKQMSELGPQEDEENKKIKLSSFNLTIEHIQKIEEVLPLLMKFFKMSNMSNCSIEQLGFLSSSISIMSELLSEPEKTSKHIKEIRKFFGVAEDEQHNLTALVSHIKQSRDKVCTGLSDIVVDADVKKIFKTGQYVVSLYKQFKMNGLLGVLDMFWKTLSSGIEQNT